MKVKGAVTSVKVKDTNDLSIVSSPNTSRVVLKN